MEPRAPGSRALGRLLLPAPAAPTSAPGGPARARAPGSCGHPGHVHTHARVARCCPPPLTTHSGAYTLETWARLAGTLPLYSLQEAENFLSATTTSASTTQVASRAAMTMAAMAPGPREPAGRGAESARVHPPSASRCPAPGRPRPLHTAVVVQMLPRSAVLGGLAGQWRPGDLWPRAPGLGWCSPRGLPRRAARRAHSTAWARAPAGPRLQGQGQALRPGLQAHGDVSPPPEEVALFGTPGVQPYSSFPMSRVR